MYREPTRWITDLVLTPAKPYLIFDVDLGVNSAETYDVRYLAETQKLLDEKGRRGLTVAETIALASHFPDIVQRNTIYATASSWQFADSEGIPRLRSVLGYPLLSNVVAEYFRVQGWVLPASCQKSPQRQVR